MEKFPIFLESWKFFPVIKQKIAYFWNFHNSGTFIKFNKSFKLIVIFLLFSGKTTFIYKIGSTRYRGSSHSTVKREQQKTVLYVKGPTTYIENSESPL